MDVGMALKESGTVEGVEHEPQKAANWEVKGVEVVRFGERLPLPNNEVWGCHPWEKVLQIYVQIGAFWSANHWRNL